MIEQKILFTSLGVACPVCDQQPGEACNGLPAGEYHDARAGAASFLNGIGKAPTVSVEAFDKAVEDSGLV